jgi:primosomal protein N'
VQVSGVAGRADRAARWLIQTDFPTHPLYAAWWRATTFDRFARRMPSRSGASRGHSSLRLASRCCAPRRRRP